MRSRFHKRVQHTSFKIDFSILLKVAVTIGLYILFFFLLSDRIDRFAAVYEFENSISDFALKNEETVFEINEITFYSSANAKINDHVKQNWSLDISQFTDISFSISNPQKKVIESLVIKNIDFNTTPEVRNSYSFL